MEVLTHLLQDEICRDLMNRLHTRGILSRQASEDRCAITVERSKRLEIGLNL